MPRLIDADALRERLLKRQEEYDTKRLADRMAYAAYSECINAIATAPTIDAEPVRHEWIRCSDRMPVANGWYLTFDGCDVFIRQMQTSGVGRRYWIGGVRFSREINGVTHWMPLPEPPKEDEYEQS